MGNSQSAAAVEPAASAPVVTAAKSTPDVAVPPLQKRHTTADNDFIDDELEEDIIQQTSGLFRGIAAATRKASLVAKKVIAAKGPAIKQAVRAVGDNRPLAFASEGAVAGDAMIPRYVYYGAWGLSGAAICADIYNKQDDAPTPELKTNTVLYWTAFHIPASLVIPALIIHQIVHIVDDAVKKPKGMFTSLSPRMKALAPVAAAMISIIPVVPAVDHIAEAIMEPTLGAYLGLTFEHHHGDDAAADEKKLGVDKKVKKA